MAKTKEIRQRIHTVASTQQLTQAMKMVAAAKLAKLQRNARHLEPFATKIEALLQQLGHTHSKRFSSVYTTLRSSGRTLLLVITSDQGFCGSYNTHVIRHAERFLEASSLDLELWPIGKKALEFLENYSKTHNADHVSLWHQFSLEKAQKLAHKLLECFQKMTYRRILVIYNPYKSNANAQPLDAEQLLPYVLTTSDQSLSQKAYGYEPSARHVIHYLIPQVVQVRFMSILLSAGVAEQSARLLAMSQATENAQKLLKELKLTHNRLRQGAITQEITEITAGAGVLRHG